MSESAPLRILTLGLEPKVVQIVEECCAGAEFTRVRTIDEFASFFEQWTDESFNVIFCGPSLDGMAGIELAQVLLNQCPSALKYYVTINTDRYEPRLLVKNGFTAAFILPMDAPLLKKTLAENLGAQRERERVYRTVKLVDLQAGEPLEFDTFLYLPRNNKYIRYTGANQPVEQEKLAKLENRSMNTLWVDHRDMNKFYQYSARKLRELGDGAVSSTEKQEKLKNSVRGLFTDIFDVSVKADFDQGRETIRQCEAIISNYITKGVTSNWYRKLLASIGEGGDSYNHASTVSTFAALFAIGLGHKHPEDLAMAGLFHDLGIAQLPQELQEKHPLQMTNEEKEIYYTHAERSVVMIKNKRIIIPDAVEKAIIMHHESYNGTGWPKRLASARITDEAQILRFADEFDYYTRFQEGRTRLTPMQAFAEIRQTGAIGSEILSQIRRLLEKETGASARSA